MFPDPNASAGGRAADKPVSPLAGAEQAARARSETQTVGDAVLPCANTAKPERKVIEVEVVGDDGVGLNGIALLLVRADQQVVKGKTGPSGLYSFKGLDPGTYELHLPELDKDAWLTKARKAWPEAQAHCANAAQWQAAAAPAQASEQVHVIEQGECIGKIAERYGFFPKTIWDFGANLDLKTRRHDDMYVLAKNDRVVIPAKRQKAETVATGQRITLQRRGVPEHLRIRFLDHDETPRTGVRYLLSVVVDRGLPVPDILGETDAHGFVDQALPPATVLATITLDPGTPREQIHKFKIGHVDPIDQISGWQARLNNLGYHCGAQDGVLGERTKAAILEFQREKDLEKTGEIDGATQAALRALSLS